MNSYKFQRIFIGILICLFLPIGAGAATLYLEPSNGQYHQGDTFMVAVRIDVDREEECINVVEANLSFSQDVLKGVDFSQGNSILTFWVQSPAIDEDSGTISFAGGIPGGYCGELLGDPGESNLLGKIIFQAKEVIGERSPVISFLENSQVLLNDGLGTPAKLTTKGAIFSILPGVSEAPKKEWQEELERDKVPPESFEIEINQEPSTFDVKYFITFNTTDKQTGVDYYEVREGKRDWQKVTSPYLLEDQSLKSIIKVKAVDKAGNERVAEYSPFPAMFPWWIIVLIIIGIIAVILWFLRKFRF